MASGTAFPLLEEMKLELETLERRKAELDVLAEQALAWMIKLVQGRELTVEGEQLHRRTWIGSALFCGAVDPPVDATKLRYYVITIRWRVRIAR